MGDGGYRDYVYTDITNEEGLFQDRGSLLTALGVCDFCLWAEIEKKRRKGREG
jgi:hypothetical protein